MPWRDVLMGGNDPMHVDAFNPDAIGRRERRFLMVDSATGDLRAVLPDERDRLIRADRLRQASIRNTEKRGTELR